MKTLGALLQVPPKAITPETLYLVGLVTVASFIQMVTFVARVGAARAKYKIMPPKIDGDPRFTLVYRAHQNCLENYPLFLAAMWSAAIFFNQVPAAIFGFLYLVAREIYFSGYSSAPEKRLVGFLLSSLITFLLFLLTGLGAASIGYRAYAGQHFITGLLKYIPVPFT